MIGLLVSSVMHSADCLNRVLLEIGDVVVVDEGHVIKSFDFRELFRLAFRFRLTLVPQPFAQTIFLIWRREKRTPGWSQLQDVMERQEHPQTEGLSETQRAQNVNTASIRQQTYTALLLFPNYERCPANRISA